MISNEDAFLTVVFPANLCYLDDFLSSLAAQSHKKIDYYFFNDGIDNLHDRVKKHNINYVEIKLAGTPSRIREIAINNLISSGYKYIVFGDSDDYFENSRIEKSLELLEKHDIVINDLNIISFDNKMLCRNYLSEKIKNNSIVKLEFVTNKNIFGLSNTAIKIKNLKKLKFNKNLIAVDWYFFSYCLLNGYSAIFTNETRTFYRQHELNTVGISCFTKDNIIKGINAKYYHYFEMSKLSNDFISYCVKFKNLKTLIENSGEKFVDDYVNKLKCNSRSNSLWWENIKCIEEF